MVGNEHWYRRRLGSSDRLGDVGWWVGGGLLGYKIVADG